MWKSSCPSISVKENILQPLKDLVPMSKISHPLIYEFTSGISIPFYYSITPSDIYAIHDFIPFMSYWINTSQRPLHSFSFAAITNYYKQKQIYYLIVSEDSSTNEFQWVKTKVSMGLPSFGSSRKEGISLSFPYLEATHISWLMTFFHLQSQQQQARFSHWISLAFAPSSCLILWLYPSFASLFHF